MQISKNARGFDYLEFVDRYGVECSLQKSSLASEDCIWLGCNDLDLQKFVPGTGWQKVELEDDIEGVHHVANTRMHLTQEMVRNLLSALQHFADTGELPDAAV